MRVAVPVTVPVPLTVLVPLVCWKLLTKPPKTTRPWLTNSVLIAPKFVMVPLVALVRLPPVTVAPDAMLTVPLLVHARVTLRVPGPAPSATTTVPFCCGATLSVSVPLVATRRPLLTSNGAMVPAPLKVAPLALVKLPPATVPPAISTVPELDHAGVTVKVLEATLSVPLLTGAVANVAPPLRAKLPLLTRALLMVPWKTNVPVLVTGPLKVVVCDTNTVAAFVSPPLKIAPATPLLSIPEPLTTIWLLV